MATLTWIFLILAADWCSSMIVFDYFDDFLFICMADSFPLRWCLHVEFLFIYLSFTGKYTCWLYFSKFFMLVSMNICNSYNFGMADNLLSSNVWMLTCLFIISLLEYGLYFAIFYCWKTLILGLFLCSTVDTLFFFLISWYYHLVAHQIKISTLLFNILLLYVFVVLIVLL